MSKHIAAFGEVMMRLEVPNYQLLSQSNQLNYSFSGTGVNVSAAMRNLGHYGYMISALPANSVGDAALSYLHKLGISSTFINRSGQYMGMYFLENGFGARPGRITYSNRLESSFNTSSAEIYDFAQVAEIIDVIHFCGITLAMNDSVRQQMKNLATAVKDRGGIVLFDCNFRPSLWGKNGYKKAKAHYEEMLFLADIVMMNENDALFTLGMETDELERETQLISLIPLVAQKYNISIIAGTQRTIGDGNIHSLQGFMFKNGEFTFSKTLTFHVLDRIGAGDAYTSGILHGDLSNFSSQETVDFAVTAAMLAHTIVGDTPLSSETDIIQAMNGLIADVNR